MIQTFKKLPDFILLSIIIQKQTRPKYLPKQSIFSILSIIHLSCIYSAYDRHLSSLWSNTDWNIDLHLVEQRNVFTLDKQTFRLKNFVLSICFDILSS